MKNAWLGNEMHKIEVAAKSDVRGFFSERQRAMCMLVPLMEKWLNDEVTSAKEAIDLEDTLRLIFDGRLELAERKIGELCG